MTVVAEGWMKGLRGGVLLAGAGVIVSLLGLVAGLVAKHFADVTSFVLSHQYTVLQSDTVAGNLALNFDKSSAHYVAPNYTWFVVGMMVVLLGLALLVAGARRTSSN